MADKKISELPAATTVDTDDEVAIVQDGVTKRAAVQLLHQITVSEDPPASPYLNQLWVPIVP